ncbi:dihydroneopterin aldolase [Parapedobacter lycopersici]|uniref:dihydroneopterin aldolase n=1 Tax=Parapedobacter lycopersici TaxID=1864939 RepID=UPI003340916E
MEQLQQRVTLRDLRFYAFHGYYPEEQVLGNEFIVEVEAVFNRSAGTAETLDATVDYEVVYRMVQEEMTLPRKLLETVAEAILDQVRAHYAFVHEARVKLIKNHPPFGGDRAGAAVELIWKR